MSEKNNNNTGTKKPVIKKTEYEGFEFISSKAQYIPFPLPYYDNENKVWRKILRFQYEDVKTQQSWDNYHRTDDYIEQFWKKHPNAHNIDVFYNIKIEETKDGVDSIYFYMSAKKINGNHEVGFSFEMVITSYDRVREIYSLVIDSLLKGIDPISILFLVVGVRNPTAECQIYKIFPPRPNEYLADKKDN